MNLYEHFNKDKKLMLKVIAGILILVIAFFSYILKNGEKDESIVITDGNGNLTGSAATAHQNTGPESEANNQNLDAETDKQSLDIVVDVSGAVSVPSVIILPEGSRVYEAVERAGGFTDEADTRLINQAEILTDGQKLYIPTKEEVEKAQSQNGATGSISIPGSDSTWLPGAASKQTTDQGLININTADAATLQQLSGIGPATAEKIINYRNENGLFQSIEDIKNVSGIGNKTFEKFKNKIKV